MKTDEYLVDQKIFRVRRQKLTWGGRGRSSKGSNRSNIVFCMNHGCVIFGTTSFKTTLRMISRTMKRSASGS